MSNDPISLKEWLDIIVVPVAIFAVGALLPRWFEAVKTRKFLALIRREVMEMKPWPEEPEANGRWCDHC